MGNRKLFTPNLNSDKLQTNTQEFGLLLPKAITLGHF